MSGGGTEELLTLCDRGIDGCAREDGPAVRDILLALLGGLDFEYEGAALALSGLYEKGLHQVERGRFELPLRVFRMLRLSVPTVSSEHHRPDKAEP